MQLIRHLPLTSDRPTAVAIGNFDGVHLGHRAVIEACLKAAKARQLVPAVLTFEPHPRRFFGRIERDFRLERLSTKLMRLREAGIARVYMPRFDRAFAALSAEQFLDQVLARSLGARLVVTGENFAFGRNRQGNAALLNAWGQAQGIQVIAVPPVTIDGHRCSSSAIREALDAGDIRQAAALLGRGYALSGTIVHGDGRGAAFGFATANIALPPQIRYPSRGVYAVTASVGGRTYDGVANLGVKPTVRVDAPQSLEVHLFGAAGDLYGQRMEVAFIARLREERRFESLHALRAQMAKDCAAAKAVHATPPS